MINNIYLSSSLTIFVLLLTLFFFSLSCDPTNPTRPIPTHPRSNEHTTPFTGQGHLIALSNNKTIGCLSNTMQILVINSPPDVDKCGTFHSSIHPGIPEYRPVTISSATQSECGFGYIAVYPPTFTPKYQIGCPAPEVVQDDSIYSVPGDGVHSGRRIMVVGLQRYYTTADGGLPEGGEEMVVFTDDVGIAPVNFQIAWESL